MHRIAFATLLLLAATAAPAQAAPVCGPPGVKTLAAGKLTRVYLESEEVWGCTRGVRRRRHLGTTYCYGSASGCKTLDHVAVAGRVAAYAINGHCCGGIVHSEVVVRDVRTGRRLERHVEGWGRVSSSVQGIVVRPTGAVAWLWHRGRWDGGPAEFVASRSPRCGEPSTLSTIADPDALWRNGAHVFWRENGADRSAPLC